MQKNNDVGRHGSASGSAGTAPRPPSDRLFAVHITVSQSFYAKLVLAHESVRRQDGSRAGLQEVLELGLDTLLRERRVSPFADKAAAEEEEEPTTVRAPVT